MEKNIVKKSVFSMKKNTHKNLKIATHRPIYIHKNYAILYYINYEPFAFYPMNIHHTVSEKSNGENKLFF